jgi:hypothetical protein
MTSSDEAQTPEELRAQIEALQRQLEQVQRTQIISGQGAQSTGGAATAATGPQSIAIGQARDVNVQIVAEQWFEAMGQPRPAADLRQASQAYLQHLLDRYRFLDLKGMGVSDRIPLRLALLEMYVPLKARIEMPDGETWTRDLRLAGRKASAEEISAIGQRLSEPQPVLELLQRHNGLIILGDPGAGKTTFLKYLTLQLAQGQGTELGLGHRLPVLLPLSAYANAHPRVGVSWYEALAYCRWLEEELAESGQISALSEQVGALNGEAAKPLNIRVMLPSEAEWEKAARGTDGRIYSWQGKLDPNHANYEATKVETTSAVGIFSNGASPYGAEEMLGNVWEWTRSL